MTPDMRESTPNSDPRELFLFAAGERTFAFFADQIEATVEAKVPAALPQAPEAVVGVVCVRGRILTVLDPIALLTGERLRWPKILPCVIALRGDEQLALAAEICRDPITTADADIQRSAQNGEDSGGLVLGLVRHGDEEITVLNPNHLFASAIGQRERRRRRF